MDQPSQAPFPLPTQQAPAPLPLRFAAPAGWPAPSVDWLAANQGWNPPPGWVPTPGVQPAPETWSWWSPDPVGWKAMTAASTASARNSIIISAAIFVVGAVLTFLPLALHESFSFIFWGALIFAPINAARNIAALRRFRGAATSFIRNKASEVRQTLDASSYSDYLAASPVEPLPFDRFLAQRSAEAWSFDGNWPTYQYHVGVTEQFRIRGPQNARSRRIGTIVFAVAAAVAVAVIVVSSVTAAPGGATASGLGASAGSQSGASSQGEPSDTPTSKYDVAWSFVNGTNTTADCTGAFGCWVVRLKGDPSCTKASLIVDFYTTKTAEDPTRTKEYYVAMKDGTVDVPVSAVNAAEQYAGVDAARCLVTS